MLAAARGDSDAITSGVDLARALVLAGFVIELPVIHDTWDDVVNTGRLYLTALSPVLVINAVSLQSYEAFASQAISLADDIRPWPAASD